MDAHESAELLAVTGDFCLRQRRELQLVQIFLALFHVVLHAFQARLSSAQSDSRRVDAA